MRSFGTPLMIRLSTPVANLSFVAQGSARIHGEETLTINDPPIPL